MEGAARAEATGGHAASVLNPALDDRGRLVRQAVATVVAALGEHVSVYRRHAEQWMRDAERGPVAAALPVLPLALRKAGERLPATPPHLIPAHRAFLKTVDRLRKQFRGDAPTPDARRTLTKRDSLSAAVRGCPAHARSIGALPALLTAFVPRSWCCPLFLDVCRPSLSLCRDGPWAGRLCSRL